MRFVCRFNFISFKYLFLSDITNLRAAIQLPSKKMDCKRTAMAGMVFVLIVISLFIFYDSKSGAALILPIFFFFSEDIICINKYIRSYFDN